MKVGDMVEIVGGLDFMKGEVCKVIKVSHDNFNLFPVQVESKIMQYATFSESHLKLLVIDNERN